MANLGDPRSEAHYLAAQPAVGCDFEDHDVIAICIEQ